MALSDLAITEANVEMAEGLTESGIDWGTLGATVGRAVPVYPDTGDSNKLKPGNCGAAGTSHIKGITLIGGDSGQPTIIVTAGPMYVGATIEEGKNYVLSNADGKIMEFDDLAAGNQIVNLGIGCPNGVLWVNIVDTGEVKSGV